MLSASGQKELFESLRAVYTFADKRTLVPIEDPKFCEDLLSLDDTLVRLLDLLSLLAHRTLV